MLTPEHALRLARIYGAATNIALSSVGRKACGNNRIFFRLAKGCGANSRTLERIEDFFLREWPYRVAWPADVPCERERHRHSRRPPPATTNTPIVEEVTS